MKRLAVLTTLSLAAAACAGASDGNVEPGVTTLPDTAVDTTVATTDPPAPPDSSTPPVTEAPETPISNDEFAGTIEVDVEDPDRCEFIGESCLLPFPSDALTIADDTSTTGRRVNISPASMPTNADGVAIDTTRLNRNDGFSPGSAALTLIPGLDADASRLAPIFDIGQSMTDDSPSVIVDATTGERWPHWAELDSNATDEEPGLFLRPAVNYTEGHRIVIGLRDLVTSTGAAIEPTDVFLAYRDRLETNVAAVEARRPDMERVFADLQAAGVDRSELVMAWEFTIISTDNLTGPMIHMRDDAFATLGNAAPAFEVLDVAEEVNDETGEARRVINGTYSVPSYLTGDGEPGSGLALTDGSDLPDQTGTFTARFRCQITDGTTADQPGAGMIYGHGLLGTERQVTSAGPTLVARNHNHVVCGTALVGMAEEDTGNAAASLVDPSNFSTLVDRLLQGHLNTLFLGRLMRHENGFVIDPNFRSDDDRPLLDTSELSYYGISQGGIMGPVATAISPDWDRGVFGVPAINYSTLLNRSIDFDTFQAILDPSFPSKLDQAIVILTIQMLWDRGEGNGYAAHFRDPLPGMNQKYALIQSALGDFQVANVATDVMARTMGASVGAPDVRSTDVEPFWGIDRIESYPFDGSAVFVFDSGTALPPITNTPPRDGIDPHEDPRRAAAAYDQVGAFVAADGAVVNTCDSACLIEPRG